ncbi:MAG: type II secretion system F family protein [Candidatus Omnitrophica bacterium]|nr:type II secretion system F family protein [Candidatus Omnitrophota bacterium]
MGLFIYKAKNKSGRFISGIIEGGSTDSVVAALQARGYFVVSVDVREKSSSSSLKESSRLIFRRIRAKDLAVFMRQLSNLTEADIPLARCLSVLIKQTESKRLKEVVKCLKSGVADGKALSEAMSGHPLVFSNLYVNMIKAGELSGTLEAVLARLADFAEKEEALKEKLKTVFIYPAAMAAVAMAVVVFLLLFVMPRFVLMFEDIGQALPLPTRVLLAGSNFLKDYWWFYLPVFFAVVLIFRQITAKEKGKEIFERLKLKIPYWGKVSRKMAVAGFLRTLSTLIKNGVPILNALSMTKETTGSRVFSIETARVYDEVKKGKSLAGALSANKEFPSMVSDLVAVGEETGRLEDSLMRVAVFYEQEVENALNRLTSLLEPAVILIMGAVVGFVVLAMLLPVFELTAVIN